MDERFRGKGIWIGLGALAIIFLCLMMCGFGAMVTMATRSSSAYGVVPQMQPPIAEEASAPPPAYYGHGPVGMGRHGGFGPIRFVFLGGGLLFTLLFFGFLLFLFVGAARHFRWGHRSWGPPFWGKPPEGEEGEGNAHAACGPWGWARYHGHWGPPPEPTDKEDDPDTPDSEYSGPQE